MSYAETRDLILSKKLNLDLSRWEKEPLIGMRGVKKTQFWGSEALDHQAWTEFAARLRPIDEIEKILAAMDGATDVLDVGGGTGTITRSIAKKFGKCFTIEPDAGNASVLESLASEGIMCRVGKAETNPYRDGIFDVVFASWILQYTDNPYLAVLEMSRVCKKSPGARVVIVQASPDNELVQIYNECAELERREGAFHGYLLACAAEILSKQGFDDITLERASIQWDVSEARHRDRPEIATNITQRLHKLPERKLEAGIGTRRFDFWVEAGAKGYFIDDGVILTARWTGL